MTTILILSCGTRNKLVRFFKEAFHSLPGGGRVIVTDCSPWAPALYEADAFYLVPPMKDPGYEDRILEICMREQVNALLPLFEDELDLLAQNRKKFEEKGSQRLYRTQKALQSAGISTAFSPCCRKTDCRCCIRAHLWKSLTRITRKERLRSRYL